MYFRFDIWVILPVDSDDVEQRENSVFIKCVCFVLLYSSTVHSQRHPEGVAGEEPPVAGAFRRAQGDH